MTVPRWTLYTQQGGHGGRSATPAALPELGAAETRYKNSEECAARLAPYKYRLQNGSAAMLAVADAVTEGNLRNPLHADDMVHKRGIHSVFEVQQRVTCTLKRGFFLSKLHKNGPIVPIFTQGPNLTLL